MGHSEFLCLHGFHALLRKNAPICITAPFAIATLIGKDVYNLEMKNRANINLDSDAYAYASAYAHAKGIPLGAAISRILRQHLEQLPELVTASNRLQANAHGLLVKARTGRTITPEMVKESSEDDFV